MWGVPYPGKPRPGMCYPDMRFPDMEQPPPDLAHPDQHIYIGPDDPVKNRQYYEDTTVTPNINIGYSYPGVTYEDLRELDHAHEMCHRFIHKWFPVRRSEATADLVAWLKRPPSDRAQAALKNLKQAWSSRSWSPDIAIKSFFDIDRAYFGGKLRGRVRLRWIRSTRRLQEACRRQDKSFWGCTALDRGTPVTQARIFLNAELMFLRGHHDMSSRRRTIGTLLHECIHAYLLTRVGAKEYYRTRDHGCPDPSHGVDFVALAVALTKRTKEDIGFEVFWHEKRR